MLKSVWEADFGAYRATGHLPSRTRGSGLDEPGGLAWMKETGDNQGGLAWEPGGLAWMKETEDNRSHLVSSPSELDTRLSP